HRDEALATVGVRHRGVRAVADVRDRGPALLDARRLVERDVLPERRIGSRPPVARLVRVAFADGGGVVATPAHWPPPAAAFAAAARIMPCGVDGCGSCSR